MAKYKVISDALLLPYYPNNSTGMPLKSNEKPEEFAALDEFGRKRVGHFPLSKGKEFYHDGGGEDEKFYTHDSIVVRRFLDLGAIEEVTPSVQVEVPKQENKSNRDKNNKSN